MCDEQDTDHAQLRTDGGQPNDTTGSPNPVTSTVLLEGDDANEGPTDTEVIVTEEWPNCKYTWTFEFHDGDLISYLPVCEEVDFVDNHTVDGDMWGPKFEEIPPYIIRDVEDEIGVDDLSNHVSLRPSDMLKTPTRARSTDTKDE